MSEVHLEKALAPHYYTDPKILEQEKEHVFFRTWQYVGHASQAANAGDYFTADLLGQSLFIIRDGDKIKAFHNVCPHRAHELLSGSGSVKRIVCPYHAWTYTTDGRLMGAPNTESVPGFDKSKVCLSQVRLENFCGFIFVNLDKDAEPMSSWYPDVEEQLRSYVPQIDDLTPYKTLPVEEACNWKVSVENYSECYHCALKHPTFANGVIDPKTYDIRAQGHSLRHTTVAANLDRMTYDIDKEANEHATEYSSWFLWPSFSFQVYPGNVLNTYLFQPVDTTNTMVHRGWYLADGMDTEMLDELAEQDRLTTVAEDISIVNSVQRGLMSKGYEAGSLVVDPNFGVNSEHSIVSLNTWLKEALDN